jgi:uncharacterized protein (TIGR03067 family)
MDTVSREAERAPGLDGAWVPVAASVAGSELSVAELRVRYLLLEAGSYRIIDRSNKVVDSGDYRLDAAHTVAALDIIGHTGFNAGRTLRAIYRLAGDELTVCYDLEGGARPASLVGHSEQLLLTIAYTRVQLALTDTSSR